MKRTPALAHSSISRRVIGREAFCTSVSPRQNLRKPPPVPEMPTVTLTALRLDFWNSSATASVIGNTVLEPSTRTVWAWATDAPPRPVATTARAPSTARRMF